MAATPEPERVQVPVSWSPLAEIPIEAANAFFIQIATTSEGQPAELVLGIGFLAPPLVTGSPADVVTQLREVREVQVKPVARLAITRERAKELRDALDQTLQAWSELVP